MLDEAARVAGLAAQLQQAVFERRQRTDPACEFHRDSPCERRQVKPCEAPAPQHEKAAEHYERDERQMRDEHGIGEQDVRHASGRARRAPIGPYALSSLCSARYSCASL
jgi:hypothetical protein